jgi:hypothetical protein
MMDTLQYIPPIRLTAADFAGMDNPAKWERIKVYAEVKDVDPYELLKILMERGIV